MFAPYKIFPQIFLSNPLCLVVSGELFFWQMRTTKFDYARYNLQ